MNEAKRAGTGDADPLLSDVAVERQSDSTTTIVTQASRGLVGIGVSSIKPLDWAPSTAEATPDLRGRAARINGRIAKTTIMIPPTHGLEPNPRLVFLARASARHALVEAREMDIGDAIAGLVDAVEDIYGERCSCADELVKQWERDFPPTCRRKRRSS